MYVADRMRWFFVYRDSLVMVAAGSSLCFARSVREIEPRSMIRLKTMLRLRSRNSRLWPVRVPVIPSPRNNSDKTYLFHRNKYVTMVPYCRVFVKEVFHKVTILIEISMIVVISTREAIR